MINIGKIKTYLKNVLGLEFEYSELLKEPEDILPAPFNHFFEAEDCFLGEQEYILLYPTVPDVKLSILIQRIKNVENRLGKTCILVVDTMNGTQRRQFIKNQICFIIPDRQVYLPVLGTYLTEKRLNTYKEVVHLTPAAIVFLLYHLQKKSLEGMSFSKIAEIIGYPPKTVSMVVSQLSQLDICDIVTNSGKIKTLSFNYSNRELWEKVFPLMSSPIQKVVYVQEEDIDKMQVVISYDNALSHYTDMADTAQPCFAISMRSDLTKNLYNEATTTNYPDSVRLELWKYNPQILSENGYIDPLSMVLCYKDDTDERVQGQLKRLINKIL